MELIFWVGIIIGGIVGIFIRNKNRFSSRVFPIDIISGIFNGMVTGFLVSLSIWITIGFIMKPKEFEQYKGEYKSLVSLEDGHGISGNFFIGIGNIGKKYAVFEKVPAHGSAENNVILAPYSSKEEAEDAARKYGYNTDNYYVDILTNHWLVR